MGDLASKSPIVVWRQIIHIDLCIVWPPGQARRRVVQFIYSPTGADRLWFLTFRMMEPSGCSASLSILYFDLLRSSPAL